MFHNQFQIQQFTNYKRQLGQIFLFFEIYLIRKIGRIILMIWQRINQTTEVKNINKVVVGGIFRRSKMPKATLSAQHIDTTIQNKGTSTQNYLASFHAPCSPVNRVRNCISSPSIIYAEIKIPRFQESNCFVGRYTYMMFLTNPTHVILLSYTFIRKI